MLNGFLSLLSLGLFHCSSVHVLDYAIAICQFLILRIKEMCDWLITKIEMMDIIY